MLIWNDFDGNSIFRNNTAEYGGGISSILNSSGNSVFRNSAKYGGGIFAQTSIVSFSGSSTFEINSAAHYGGGIYAVYNPLMNFNGNIIFRNNSANSEGGGIYVLYSNLPLIGNAIFRKNSGGIAGGIYAKVCWLSCVHQHCSTLLDTAASQQTLLQGVEESIW